MCNLCPGIFYTYVVNRAFSPLLPDYELLGKYTRDVTRK